MIGKLGTGDVNQSRRVTSLGAYLGKRNIVKKKKKK